ncbi:MAG: translation initiation factor IF-3, partial [Microbacteriaceae bacterium]
MDGAPSACRQPPSSSCDSRRIGRARTHTKKESRISDPRTNDRIRVPEVRLVGPGGEQVGIVRIEDALRLAREADLDLVEVAPNSRPPVVKIMDYGKFKYEEAQKAKEARRNQANTILKEVRFRLKIDRHDYETKRKRAEGFLSAGDKVKAMILFRGREQSRPEQGVRLLQRFAEDIAEFGSVESNPTIDGRNMVMVIAPHKNKATAKAEANERRQAQRVQRSDVAVPDAVAPEAAPAVTAAVVAAPVAAEPVEAPAAGASAVEASAVEAPAAAPEPIPATSVAVEAVTPKPTAAKPAAAKPTTAKPAAAKPAAAKPAAPAAAR